MFSSLLNSLIYFPRIALEKGTMTSVLLDLLNCEYNIIKIKWIEGFALKCDLFSYLVDTISWTASGTQISVKTYCDQIKIVTAQWQLIRSKRKFGFHSNLSSGGSK